MLRHLTLFLVLLAFWVLLSGQVDFTQSHQRYLFGCGIVSCAFATYVAARVGFLYEEGDFTGIVLRQPPYLVWLLGQILVSNLDVARRVWAPKLDISPEVLRIPYETETDLATAIYANSITLTPGTVSVMVDEERREILIHALTKGKEASLRDMHDRVHRLEKRT